MSIKNLTLIAATLATTAAFASTASAGSFFEAGNTINNGPVLEVGYVQSDSDGVIAVYNYSAGVQGTLVGKTSVNAGANPSVEIDADRLVVGDVIAVLEVDGQAVATKKLIINQ
tara:strand:+ start:11457 stop:11798 length:342 start_codon:yes stop_codon:yes gene_type:complete